MVVAENVWVKRPAMQIKPVGSLPSRRRKMTLQIFRAGIDADWTRSSALCLIKDSRTDSCIAMREFGDMRESRAFKAMQRSR